MIFVEKKLVNKDSVFAFVCLFVCFWLTWFVAARITQRPLLFLLRTARAPCLMPYALLLTRDNLPLDVRPSPLTTTSMTTSLTLGNLVYEEAFSQTVCERNHQNFPQKLILVLTSLPPLWPVGSLQWLTQVARVALLEWRSLAVLVYVSDDPTLSLYLRGCRLLTMETSISLGPTYSAYQAMTARARYLKQGRWPTLQIALTKIFLSFYFFLSSSKHQMRFSQYWTHF